MAAGGAGTTAGLSYGVASGHYTFGWQTSAAWAGTCRGFTIQLNDGSTDVHSADVHVLLLEGLTSEARRFETRGRSTWGAPSLVSRVASGLSDAARSTSSREAGGAGRRARFEPIRTVRTFETAIGHILEGVERGRLRRGDRLPNEAELAAQLGISKPTLRQALLVLERAGLVDVRLGKTGGVFVDSDLVPSEAIATAVTLEERSVIDVLRSRRVLETAVVHYVIDVADEGDYGELDRSIGVLRAHIGDRTAVMWADEMFHRALVRASHNDSLRAAMRTLDRRLAPIRDAYSGGHYWDARIADIHQRQLDAMRAHHRATLDPILHEHFRMLEDAYCAALGADWAELFASPRSARLPARASRGSLTPKGKRVLLFDGPWRGAGGDAKRETRPAVGSGADRFSIRCGHADCSAGPVCTSRTGSHRCALRWRPRPR